MGKKRGERNAVLRQVARWNSIQSKGYLLDGKGRLVHRNVCWKAHGPFPRDWVVHHIDEDKSNNSPDNLIAMPRKVHETIHKVMKRNGVRLTREEIQSTIKCWRHAQSNKQTQIQIVINRIEESK